MTITELKARAFDEVREMETLNNIIMQKKQILQGVVEQIHAEEAKTQNESSEKVDDMKTVE